VATDAAQEHENVGTNGPEEGTKGFGRGGNGARKKTIERGPCDKIVTPMKTRVRQTSKINSTIRRKKNNL